MIRHRLWTAAVAAVFYSVAAHASDVPGDPSFFDPESGLRIHQYTEAVPARVPGGTVVDTEAVRTLIAEGAVLIDVLSINDVRYDELDGTWPEFPERRHIPGSLWLPNVGFGRPAPDMMRYLLNQVGQATNQTKQVPIVVYCVPNCWMGWNAVQHLARNGYKRVYWYPDGTEAWTATGGDSVIAEPQPVEVE